MSLPETATLLAGPIIVRRPLPDEIDAIWEVAQAIPTAAHWTRRDFDAYCRAVDSMDTQVKALFVACMSAATDGVNPLSVGETIAGFAAFSSLPWPGGGECTLENMAVGEQWRRQGLARRMIAAGSLWCRAWCGTRNPDTSAAGIVLEVRASNRGAIAFYEQCGFVGTGSRHGYYARPEDDAVLMAKPFRSSCSTSEREGPFS